MNKKINLILLPGLDGTGDLFEPIRASLQANVDGLNINCIIVRYPKAGLMDYAALTVFAQKSIPANEPYLLLGESFSGPIAIAIAANKSPQLKGLILAATFARNPWPIFSNLGFLLPNIPLNGSLLMTLSMPLIGKLLAGSLNGGSLKGVLKQVLNQVPTSTLRHRLQQVLKVNVTPSLRQVQVPILYLQAKYDALLPAAAFNCIAEYAPQAEIVVLSAPHMLLQHKPDEAACVIAGFCSRLIETH